TSVGFNCFSFSATIAGREHGIIWSEPEFGPQSELALHGIPLLFPFAGRIEGGEFTYRGEHYAITGGMMAGGNAIHGFVISRPWRVIAQSASEVTGEFHASADDHSLLSQWPADFRIRVTYRVSGRALICDVTVDNPDVEARLPFGFGTHPYFRMPNGARDSRISFPAAAYWLHENGLPAGEIAPVSAAQDFQSGQSFDGVAWDGVTTELTPADDGLVHTLVTDPETGLAIDQSFPPDFNNVVVWVPPHRDAIAVEPWTTVPNAFALEKRGIDTGLLTLEPGESWATRITFELTPLALGY
ncbi:MAG: aldose 1-epimerase, partial [Thermomicrobiales bacterium]|nr:aldose 1-epimerase [Thermomicrobiales bacterium]